jgi:putative transposase
VLDALKERVSHAKKTLSSRGDHSQALGSRGCPRSGKVTAEVCKQLGVAEQTDYRWRCEYGGLKVDQAKKLKELEKENARLKRLLSEAELDKVILKEAARETSEPGEATTGSGTCSRRSGPKEGIRASQGACPS